jgi:zinc protease
VERVRRHWLVRLQERAQDTSTVASDRFYEALFGREHGYGRPIVGYEAGVDAVTRADVAAFHRSHFTPRGGIIVVSGALRTQAVVERLEAAFGDWKSPLDPVATQAPTLAQVGQRHFSLLADKVQSDVVVGSLGPARGHPDYYAVRVANCILGQFGLMGRLGERVREELGLAYYCYSATLAEEQAGTWVAAAGVAPANVEATVASVLSEFARLGSQPVADSELADTQAYLTGVVPLALETNQGVASTLFNMELYGLGLDYLARYSALISSVTADDVRRVAATYLQPETALVAVAGPDME